MSRGPGRVQRGVLEALADGPADTEALAERVYGCITRSGYEAIRRALRSLERQGRVRQCDGRRARIRVEWDDGARSWRDRFEVSVAKRSPRDVCNT
jgi:hypothetical protein